MKTIGKYEILGLLGRGGMSKVYKVRLPVIGKIVALKLFSPHPHMRDLLGEAETRHRFIAEAIKMARLRHPYVVEILDFDVAGSSPFFTMEYYYQDLGMILGESYRIESPCRMLSLDKVIHYTRRLLLGLSHLHRSGIVHRDIKPSNLLINDENDLKISDFGLSKLRGERLRNPSNLVVGSPYYAAPEQENDPENVDVRADLYSVGIILHRVLTGRFPDGEDLLPSACHPEADASWDSFVLRAIDPSREKRFPGSAAMLIELERLAASWEEKKRDICRTASLQGKPSCILGTALQWVRDAPVKVDPGRAPEVFHCDALWRPIEYIRHNLQAVDDDVVFDRQNGLLWERTGAKDPLDWKEAHAYVQQLNECRFAGSRRWRLPTVNELFSILEPFTFGAEDCMAGPFDRGKRWLWSADRRSFIAAWYVDCELGFASWSDFTCRYYVRAVCRE